MYLSIRQEPNSVQDSAIQDFKIQLDQRIAALKKRLPELYLEAATPSSTMKDLILNTFYPANPAYKNREVQCAFVRRLLAEVQEPVLTRLRDLTQNGQICTAGDLPKEQRINWTSQWIHLLWNDKWFVTKTGPHSLEDLIIKKIGIENYSKPEIIIALNEGFDGYGAGHSRFISPLFDQDPTLQQFKQLGLQFNPSNPEPFTLMGHEIQRVLKEENPYGASGLVRTKSEIYISPVWPVAELVELLVHEYGHVLHGEQSPNQKWDPVKRILYRKNNGTHNEGVAEAFAEMMMADIFQRHPETEIFHLAKLRLFAEIRPQDTHLQGAVALSSVFFQGQQDFSKLLNLTRTANFRKFLTAHNIDKLSPGQISDSVLPVYFKK